MFIETSTKKRKRDDAAVVVDSQPSNKRVKTLLSLKTKRDDFVVVDSQPSNKRVKTLNIPEHPKTFAPVFFNNFEHLEMQTPEEPDPAVICEDCGDGIKDDSDVLSLTHMLKALDLDDLEDYVDLGFLTKKLKMLDLSASQNFQPASSSSSYILSSYNNYKSFYF